MAENFFLAVLLPVLWLAAVCTKVYLSMALARSAVYSLVRRFRVLGAVHPGAAVSAEDLGLRPHFPDSDFMRSAAIARNHKPQALQLLIAREAVLVTGDNQYYLSEEALHGLGPDFP